MEKNGKYYLTFSDEGFNGTVEDKVPENYETVFGKENIQRITAMVG